MFLTIGTAKPTKKELSEANHHFINNISVEGKYSSGIFFSREANAFLSNYFLKMIMLFSLEDQVCL